MNWKTMLGSELTIDGEKMTVTDYCRGCRHIWAESEHERFFLGIKRDSEEIYIKSRKLKPLE